MLACGRYAECREVFADSARFVSSRGVGLSDFAHDQPWRAPSIVLEVDPPDHTKTRTVLMRVLSPRRVNEWIKSFQDAADTLVDSLLERVAFDGVGDLAEVFPTTVCPHALGLHAPDRRRLVDYGAMVFNALGPDNDLRRAALAGAAELVPWIATQCQREQLEPGGFGAAIYAAADSGEISADEAGMLVRSLLSAGVDTTVTALGNALWCLATHPQQFRLLQDDPTLARATFEETLRFTSPVHAFCRTAAKDTTVGNINIGAGSKILCVLGAANLDPTQWTQAHQFDIARGASGHLAFGVGIHACVGQNVARAEGEAVLRALARKVGRLELDSSAQWRANNAVHGLDSLPLRMTRK
jgi:cytochrome P450